MNIWTTGAKDAAIVGLCAVLAERYDPHNLDSRLPACPECDPQAIDITIRWDLSPARVARHVDFEPCRHRIVPIWMDALKEQQ